ncbi:M35 family metallo-endopeptidase [Arthrobacter sp. AB6]|nr:M35 family metallo-endopeptidase [Arthrobacter sp. AB6]
MSTLQELLVTLNAVNRDAERYAAELGAQAQRLSNAASRAAGATRESSRGDGGQTVIALQAASKAVSQAARHLHQAAITGKSFVTRHSPAPSGATTKNGVTGTNVPRSLGALVARLTGTTSTTKLGSLPALNAAVTGALSAASASLTQWDTEAQQLCEKWFGSSDESTRQQLAGVVQRMQQHAASVNIVPFEDGKGGANTFAYVYPSDPLRRVFVGELFWRTDTNPPDSQAGVILHELSHFSDVAGTSDHAYGIQDAEQLSASYPELALENADNIEYYFEEFLNQ